METGSETTIRRVFFHRRRGQGEDSLIADLSLVHPRLMLIGRQVTTAFGKLIDLLGMDEEGSLVVVELKRKRTPREVVAQLLDYASWVTGLSRDEILGAYSEKNSGKELEKGFADAFGTSLPDEINQGHRLIVVATDLDPSTKRIINDVFNRLAFVARIGIDPSICTD